MPQRATLECHNRIALVFDLDDTLAPDTYGSVVASCGIDPDRFEREQVDRLRAQGWDEIPAKFYSLIAESERRGGAITADHLKKVAGEIQFFDGVPEMFDRVKGAARDLVPDVEVEFYILSSGLLDIARSLRIADRFTEIWGCAFHFGEQGEIKFLKRLITHPEKVRYLLALSKGIAPQTPEGRPADVYRSVDDNEIHVPLDQLIYLGDGASDVPAFSMLHDRGGIAIGVFKQRSVEEWPTRDQMRAGTRVQNLAPADFSDGSELMQSLILAVEQICKRIALRQLSAGE